MATAAVTNVLVDAATIEAAEHNTNFNDLVSFLNNDVVHRDGSKAMTGALTMGANKITNVLAGTAGTDAATRGEVTYETLDANLDVGSGATQVARGNHAHADAFGGAVSFSRNGVAQGLASAVMYEGDAALGTVIGTPIPYDFIVRKISVIISSPRTAGTLSVSFRNYNTGLSSSSSTGTLVIDDSPTQYNESTSSGTITGPRVLIPVLTTSADFETSAGFASTDVVASYWVERA